MDHYTTGSSSGVVFPTLDQTIELGWTSAIAKSRGIFGFDSIDARSRSFNLIRARLLELRQERGWRLFGVLSATPNVGKSFITANLSASLSRNPRHQTYAIDFDLRRGSLTSQFGISPDSGLREYLEGSETRIPQGYSFEDERLIVLPTTPGLVHSAELLSNQRTQDLLRSARTTNDTDVFLFDLPPVFANDDAAIAMSRLDGYILVAEEGKTKQRELKDVASLLGPEKLAGVVLNKYRGGLFSEGYGVDDYYVAGYATRDEEA